MSYLSTIAAEELARRTSDFQRAVNADKWSAKAANAALMPWVAIALFAGHEPPAAEPVLEDWRQIISGTRTVAGKGRAKYSATEIRRLAADDLCPRADWQAELTRARDVAVAAAMKHPDRPAVQSRSIALQSLAIALGIPAPMQAEPARQAA